MKKNEIVFDNIIVTHCICQGTRNLCGCLCGHDEQVIRGLGAGVITAAMTKEQRQWCISEAVWFGEGMFTEAELQPLSDRDLAYRVMIAWLEYAHSQGF